MLTQCPACDKAIVIRNTGAQTCPNCGAAILMRDPTDPRGDEVLERLPRTEEAPADPAAATIPAGGELSPWEQRSELGWGAAAWRTWRLSVFSPQAFFGSLDAARPAGGVILYGVLVVGLAGMAYFATNAALTPWMLEMARQTGDPSGLLERLAAIDPVELRRQALLDTLLSPALSWALLYGLSGIYQLMLSLLLPGRGRGLPATLRAVVYGSSPALLAVVPGIGLLLALPWTLAIHIRAMAAVHNIPRPVATLAVAVPSLLLMMACISGFGGAG